MQGLEVGETLFPRYCATPMAVSEVGVERRGSANSPADKGKNVGCPLFYVSQLFAAFQQQRTPCAHGRVGECVSVSVRA